MDGNIVKATTGHDCVPISCPAGQYAPPLPDLLWIHINTKTVINHSEYQNLDSVSRAYYEYPAWENVGSESDCYRPNLKEATAVSPLNYVIGVPRKVGRITMTATARLGIAAESFIRTLGRGTEFFIRGLGRVTYSAVCDNIGSALVAEEVGRSVAQRLALRVAQAVAVAVRTVTSTAAGIALSAACIKIPINNGDSTSTSKPESTPQPTVQQTQKPSWAKSESFASSRECHASSSNVVSCGEDGDGKWYVYKWKK